jgi:CDP-diacylglycerol--serine O-phosphatidyltransferase
MRRRKGKKNMKRGIYILPSIFTSLSLFSGFYSITAALNGNFLHAAWAIIIAALFDAADGRIARLTRSVSKFGEHYDSLADMISFGAAPAILFYLWALQPFGRWGWLATFLYIICVALRLARFNVQTSTIEKKYFQGLPSPPSAIMIAMTVIFFRSLGITEVVSIVMPLLTCFLALLMVSTLKYHSFKDFDFRKRRPFNVLVALIFLLIILLGEPEISIFSGAVLYTLSGPVEYLCTLRKKKLESDIIEDSRYS